MKQRTIIMTVSQPQIYMLSRIQAVVETITKKSQCQLTPAFIAKQHSLDSQTCLKAAKIQAYGKKQTNNNNKLNCLARDCHSFW